MRRVEFTIQTQNHSSGRWRNSSRLLRAFGFVALLFITNWGTSAFAQCALVCNDDVNVSLPGTNANCTVEVLVDMVLEDPTSCNAPMEVTLMNLQGTPLPSSPYLNASHIGETFIYSVTELNSGNSCWGTITVEDKLGPNIDGCVDLTLPCVLNYKPTIDGGDAPTPLFTDCSGVLSSNYSDVISTNNCGGQGYVAIIQRTWTAVDMNGYVSNCTQTITVERVSLANYLPVCPPNLALECTTSMPSTDPSATGYPMIEINGVDYPVVPGAEVFCELAASYSDELFDICGGGHKILRTWNIYDWCLDTDPTIPNPFTCIQVIKVEDKTPPVIFCPPAIVHDAAAAGCSASLMLPPATVSDICSDFDVKVLTPFGIVDGNGGLLLNVPVGTHDITYVTTDDCGNINSCQITLTIEDNTPPVGICDEHTTVSLTADGTAIVAAEVFDDGSSDNCTIDRFKVRRMSDVIFEDYVSFDCSDVDNGPIMVVMRVWDTADNYNECMIDVEVQDKLGPSITCPAPKTIQCFDPVPAVEAPTITDNCGSASWTQTEVNSVNDCGVGLIYRNYVATDIGGLTDFCQQTITVINSFVFTENNIDWPSDYFAEGCMVGSLEPEDLPVGFDRPTVNEGPCDNIVVTHTDQELPINLPACFKILRKWIVIDWCHYDPNVPNSPGYWEYTQILKVQDNTPPVLTCPADMIVDGDDPNCLSEFVTIPAVTATDCSSEFDYQTTVDLFNNGSNDFVFGGPDASSSYPFGIHLITFQVSDRCGNTSVCSITLNVRDAKKPTPVCANGVAAELMPDNVNGGGMIQLQPEMFDLGSFDNCTAAADLEFNLTPSQFDCNDVGTNVVYLYVTDGAGNTDFCETYVLIQDNMVICPAPLTADVAGGIATAAGSGVADVTVNVSGNGPLTPSQITDQNGRFQFFDLGLGHDYTFTPSSNSGYLNGVTTYDLVLMTQHILNVAQLDSPYKLIAGDVNNSGAVTTSDIVELRKLILQISTEFSNNTSWRFVDKDYVFPNPQNPFEPAFPEFYNINDLDADDMGVDFVAVKIGDVNGTASTNLNGAADDRGMAGELTFVVDDREVRAGETFDVAFKANNFINLFGYQFALQFDAGKMELDDIEMGGLTNLTKANFGLAMLDEGIITTSWDNSKNILHDNNTILFTLKFKAISNTTLSGAIRISDTTIPAEAYKNTGNHEVEMLGIGLTFNNLQGEEHADFELLQNNPNPFKELTTIRFRLPQAGTATLTVYDLSGKALTTVSGSYAKGYNEITISEDELGSAGVLFYQLETQEHTATRRMVRL
ncbi:MAG TPA: HYR domain-containing protein [Bacteroidetes bacterium]|nr:HYR domain-containing protein [Bacteroidota bacterium]